MRFDDGTTAEIGGAFQSSAVVIGDEHSVGWFHAPAGTVRVRCAWSSSARSSDRPFLVTPGTPDVVTWPLGMILGGCATSAIGMITIVRADRR